MKLDGLSPEYLSELVSIKDATIAKLLKQNSELRQGKGHQVGWLLQNNNTTSFVPTLSPNLKNIEVNGEKLWKPVYL